MSSPPDVAADAGAADRPGGSSGRVAGLRSVLGSYIALTKPRIIWLLLITTVPAMVVAAGGWPGSGLVASTVLGGMLAAGGANAINQYADRDIDRLMRRTSGRPLVRGVVRPQRAAAFGVVLSLISVAWLASTVNALAAALAAAAIAFYVVAYTYYLKRTTTQNIVIGGAAGAAPPVIGWAAVTGSVEIEAALLFLVVFYWTPPHFWALSLLLADDYERAGVPMLPVVRGERETKRQIVLYSFLLVPLTLIFGAAAEMQWLYFATAAAGGGAFIGFAFALIRRPGIEGARALFRFSVLYLALLFVAMAADRLLLA
ncbi:MAG: heme o synthase [Chloroflexi bacterium]|nr:heme o synthase [Chloroflexota bacterium]